MLQPAQDSVRDLPQCLDAYRSFTASLHALGITIEDRPLPAEDLATWDGHSHLCVRGSAELDERLWVLIDLWMLLCIGPEATGGAVPVSELDGRIPQQRRLRSVPFTST